MKVDQVCIGSCTNSSLLDMLKVAAILKGKTVASRRQPVHFPRLQAGACTCWPNAARWPT